MEGDATHAGASDTGVPDAAASDAAATSVADVETVPLTVLSGPVPTCPESAEHPSICCVSGPNQATVCTEDTSRPFTPCPNGALTFPDPRSCCSPDGDAPCSPPSAPASADAANADCNFPCGPGGFLPGIGYDAEPGFESCAEVDAGPCSYCCTGAGESVACTGNSCSCPFEGPGSPPCVCGPQCPACPSGWGAARGFPDLCCRTDGGMAQCFSQAASIEAPSGSGSGPCFTSGTECWCGARGDDGHAYDVTCEYSQNPPCTCSVDGAPTGHGGTTCSFSDCGFPASLAGPF